MQQDLQALAIEVDAWCNPLEQTFADGFARSHVHALEQMQAAGKLVERPEVILYCEQRRRYAVGCWLLGRCPLCDGEVGGYCCERCGYHFLPEEVVAPRDRRPGGALVPRQVICTHLRLPSRERLAAPPGVPAALRETIIAYLERRQGLFRQTIPGSWGLRLPSRWDAEQVLFSYGAVGYALYLGELYRALRPEAPAPFAAGSDVTVLVSCGIDNIVPLCVGMQGALLAIGCRPIDGFLVNWFLDLEGQKFSTSRGHVISASDWLARTPMTSDELRYVLCRLHPGAGPVDLRIDEVARMVEELTPLGAIVERLVRSLPPEHLPGRANGDLEQLVREWRREQADALDPVRCDPARAARQLPSLWASPPRGDDADRSYWWLKALALLCYPIMPTLATALWRRLGGTGPVTEAAFWERTRPCTTPSIPEIPVVRSAQLRSCMP